MSAMVRDSLEIVVPSCRLLINQQADKVVISVEGVDDSEEDRYRLELDPKDALHLASFLETAANEARKVQDEIRKEMEPK